MTDIFTEGFHQMTDQDKIIFLTSVVIAESYSESQKIDLPTLERKIMSNLAETVPGIYERYQVRVKAFMKSKDKPYRAICELYSISKVNDLIFEGPSE